MTHFLVNDLNIRAKKHLMKKQNIIKDLIFLWESERLDLVKKIKKNENVENSVKLLILQFDQ